MIWFALLVLCGIAAAPFVIERRKPDMDDEVRARAPGQFAKLSDGNTHFQWHGPADGPVLVCVHGLSTPSFVWNAMLPDLTAAGYRVLTYDLYGRGYSDRPNGAQTRSFFIRQLRDLLKHENVGDGFSIMGYSMGGSIVSVFASEEPERLSHLILLAPAGMAHNPSRLSELAQKLPYIGDWLMLAFGGRELRKGALIDPGPGEFSTQQIAEIGWRGYLPAILSSQRHFLPKSLEEEHRNIQKTGLPVFAIWGELDTVIPLSAMGKLAEWNRSARQATIPNAHHGLAMTHPTEIIEALGELMAAKP